MAHRVFFLRYVCSTKEGVSYVFASHHTCESLYAVTTRSVNELPTYLVSKKFFLRGGGLWQTIFDRFSNLCVFLFCFFFFCLKIIFFSWKSISAFSFGHIVLQVSSLPTGRSYHSLKNKNDNFHFSRPHRERVVTCTDYQFVLLCCKKKKKEDMHYR